MENRQVCHAWAHGNNGRGSNLSTDGVTLTSYYTTIAARIDGIIYISQDNMSGTTSKHLSYARQAVNHKREDIFYTPAFSWSGSNPALTHEAMILPAVRDALQTVEYALNETRTRQATKMKAVQAYLARRAEIVTLAARVGVNIPDMPEMEADAAGLAAYEARRAAAYKAKQERDAEALRVQRELDAADFATWLTTGAARCPASYSRRPDMGTDYITVRGAEVVTSQGATCPLDHAIKALAFYRGRTADGVTFDPWKTNGHKIALGIFTLDSINERGSVRAGCHAFTAAEISRFMDQWREVIGL